MRVEQVSLDEWADVLPSTGFEPFHLPEALEVVDRYAPGEMRLFGGFKGDHPVALLPVFVRRNVVGRAVSSPPPGMGIPRLGPILMPNSPKRRKREKVNVRFVDGVLSELGAGDKRTLLRLVASTNYTDPRPFRWRDFDLHPTFTYRIDLSATDRDDLLTSFSKDLRKDIRRGEDLDVTVGVEADDAASHIVDDVAARYDEQGLSSPLDHDFVGDLLSALDDRARVYVVRDPDGEFLNGMIALYSNDAVYTWQGGTARDYDGVSVTSLLEWEILSDAMTDPPVESVDTFDMTGANSRRHSEYKSAFGGRLVPYYRIESGGTAMAMAKKTYQMLPT